ncbi:MAG: ATP-grasp domain-containing protein [Chloroflexi bacterium]|nr:ATP-grasp domain-containing protein [Chloroflexota bacterium]
MVETLLRVARERGVALIFPVTDEVILPLSQHRDRFEGISALALPEPHLLSLAHDKQVTLELANQLGVPTPRTELVRNAREAIKYVRKERRWPIVLKPQTSRVYRDGRSIDFLTVTYANSERQLRREMARFEGRCNVLLQEYYRGEGHGVELLLQDGAPLAAFQHRRIREVPLTGGASSFRESVPLDPELESYALSMLGTVSWTGLAMVEFRLGDEGPKLMEINGRVWGSLPLAVKCGVDFPLLAAELHTWGAVRSAAAPTYAVGKQSRNLELDLVWITSVLAGKRRHPFLPYPSRRDAVQALLGVLQRTGELDVFTQEDPAPALAELVKIAMNMRRKLAEAR